MWRVLVLILVLVLGGFSSTSFAYEACSSATLSLPCTNPNNAAQVMDSYIGADGIIIFYLAQHADVESDSATYWQLYRHVVGGAYYPDVVFNNGTFEGSVANHLKSI